MSYQYWKDGIMTPELRTCGGNAQSPWLSDYDEALLIIAGRTELLPERRHLTAPYELLLKFRQR